MWHFINWLPEHIYVIQHLEKKKRKENERELFKEKERKMEWEKVTEEEREWEGEKVEIFNSSSLSHLIP